MQQRYNAIIIGFGKGGKTLAAYLADQGQSVAIVERSDKMYGGTCINIACIPTKTLVYEAHKSLCRGERSFEEKAADYRRAITRKNEVTGFLRGKNYAMLADRDNVDVITGTASFVSPHEVEVKTADKTLLLSGERIFINTGGETVIPPIEGVRENPRVYTSTTMLELEDLPSWSSSAAVTWAWNSPRSTRNSVHGSPYWNAVPASLPAKTPMWPTASARRWKTRA